MAKEKDELVAYVIGVGTTIGLFGCASDGALLEAWAPAVAMRVRSRGGEIGSSAATGPV